MFRFAFAALAIALAAPATNAADAKKGTALPFPAKAPIVVSINGYDTARGRLNKLLTAALPKDAARVTKLLDGELDQLFEGRKLDDVRKDARGFVVLNDLASLIQDTPAVSVFVPVTKHKDFLKSFLTKEEFKTLDNGKDGVDSIKTAAFGEEQPAYLVDLKDYTAITLDKATAEAHAAKFATANSDQLGTDLAETFLKADLALYVNMDAINDQFGDQIREFKGLVDFALQQAAQQGALGSLNKKQIEAVKVILKGLVQGVEDSRGVVAAVELRPEGVFVRLQIRFSENSPSAKLLATEKPETMADIAKLPTGLGTYTAMKFGKAISEVVRDLGQEFATTDDDGKGAELLEQHLKAVADAGPGAEYSAALPPAASITVTAYKDADKAAKGLAKAFKAIGAGGRVNGIVVKSAPRVGDDAEKHAGFTFASVNLNFDFEASVAALPEMVRDATLEAFKRAVPEKAAQWIGSDGKVVVRVMAKDWEAAKKLIDQYLGGKATIGANAGFKKVREQLPAEANVLFIAEIESAINGLVAAMKPAADAIPGFPQIGIVKKVEGGQPAYLGFAVTLKGEVATVTGFVPIASLETAAKMLESLFKKVE
ncbi:MAG: hypothetical protein C0467_13305 [Planctomycetaceae bacterium]|nr:hypothetical protein [Planctomycetaceae bacterium]